MNSTAITDNRKLQIVQASILDDIDSICRENGLTYYLIGGTLLGAVRHKGFIPWDDDIDLVMYREDYNKLVEIINRRHSEKYFAQTFESDKEYTRYILKIRLNGTKHIEFAYEKSSANQGIYVDIFPLDYVKKSDGLGLKIRGGILRMLFAYKSIRFDALPDRTKKKVFISRNSKWITYIVPNKFVNWLFDFICEMDNNKCCCYTTNFASHFKWKKQLFSNDVYGEGCPLEFEGKYYNAPVKYDEILRRLYGDNYMEVPPKEKQITHKIVKLDLGKYDIWENSPTIDEFIESSRGGGITS